MFAAITKLNADDYITIQTDNRLYLYKNNTVVYESAADLNMNGAVYINGLLYYTKESSNIVYIYNIDTDFLEEIPLTQFSTVRLLKAANPISRLVFCVNEPDAEETVVYDILSKELIIRVPSNYMFYDIYFDTPNTARLCCEDSKSTAVYADDTDCEITIYAAFSFNKENNIEYKDKIYVNIGECGFDEMYSIHGYKGNIKMPLFDQYFWEWPYPEALSENYIIFHCDNFNGIIISDKNSGDVRMMFPLPYKKLDNNMIYAFNEKSNVFTVIRDNKPDRYKITLIDESVINKLNTVYNAAYANKKMLRSDFDFKRLFFKAIEAVKCEKL